MTNNQVPWIEKIIMGVVGLCQVVTVVGFILTFWLYFSESPLEPLGRRIYDLQETASVREGRFVDDETLEKYGSISWPRGVETMTLYATKYTYCIKLAWQGEFRFVSEKGVSQQACKV